MSDLNLIQAADEVRKMLRGFKAVEMVSAALENVGSLQNAGKEAEKLLAAIRSDVARAEAALVAANSDVTLVKEEAKKLLADAKRKAEDRLAKADAEIAVRVSDSDAVVAAAAARAQSLEALAHDAKADVASAQKELEDLNGKIAKAKAGIAKILGQ